MLKHKLLRMSNNATDVTNSNLNELLKSIGIEGINTGWTKKFGEPKPETVQLRSITYKHDQKKQISASSVFKLIYAQAFKTDIMIDHIAMHPSSWFNQNISLDDMSTFTIIIHLQVKSIKTSFITYHVLEKDMFNGYNKNGTPIIKGDRAFTKLLDLILNCNDKTIRNNRIKLIPRIVEGPYPVKRVVENRPVLLGNKVSQTYYRGINYFEIDSRVDESMVAASIIKLCHRFAKRIVVDMAWTLQGEEFDELPERLFCGCTVYNMDFSKCKDLKYEMENCQKLIYKKNNNNNNDSNKQQQDEQKENK